MTSCRVHNVRFYKPVPRVIHCMAYENKCKKLALSRSDGSLEIWDLSYTPHIERTIPAKPDGSVEDLAWCKDRLFSTGLNGMITEYSLLTLQTKSESSLTSGPGWCLAINKKKMKLAAGTEDGYINIFDIEEDSLAYVKILDKQEGRILCLAWHNMGEVIVTGSSDSVRVWNVHSGHAIYRMTTGRAETNRETIVWCVAIADDFTIISGDSRGCLCFWDGQMGTQTQKIQSHKADILTLSLTEDQSTVYCAGVDPLIVSFAPLKACEGKTGRTKWVRSIDRRVHENDVRALVSTGENQTVYSGGVDGYLAHTSYPPKLLLKYSPIMQPPCVTLCPLSRCVLLRYTSHLEVWQLGRSLPDPLSDHGLLPLDRGCVQLLRLAARNAEPMVCCSMSGDSRWLAYSTPTVVRFFSFSTDGDDGKPCLRKLNGYSSKHGPAQIILFSPDGSFAVIVSVARDFNVVQMTGGEPTIVHTLQPHAVLKDLVHLVTFSPDGRYLVAADRQSNIGVWTASDWSSLCVLPRLKVAPTAMAVQGGTDLLVVVYADHRIVEFSLKGLKYTKFSRRLDHNHPRQWLSRNFPVTGVTFDPRNEDVVILHDDNTICVVDRTKELPSRDAKIPRVDAPNPPSSSEGTGPGTESAFHFVKKYKHLVHFGWLDGEEIVAVEVTPLSLEEQLPPSLKQKRFGMQ